MIAGDSGMPEDVAAVQPGRTTCHVLGGAFDHKSLVMLADDGAQGRVDGIDLGFGAEHLGGLGERVVVQVDLRGRHGCSNVLILP